MRARSFNALDSFIRMVDGFPATLRLIKFGNAVASINTLTIRLSNANLRIKVFEDAQGFTEYHFNSIRSFFTVRKDWIDFQNKCCIEFSSDRYFSEGKTITLLNMGMVGAPKKSMIQEEYLCINTEAEETTVSPRVAGRGMEKSGFSDPQKRTLGSITEPILKELFEAVKRACPEEGNRRAQVLEEIRSKIPVADSSLNFCTPGPASDNDGSLSILSTPIKSPAAVFIKDVQRIAGHFKDSRHAVDIVSIASYDLSLKVAANMRNIGIGRKEANFAENKRAEFEKIVARYDAEKQMQVDYFIIRINTECF